MEDDFINEAQQLVSKTILTPRQISEILEKRGHKVSDAWVRKFKNDDLPNPGSNHVRAVGNLLKELEI